MARRIVNRKELRAEHDAAERRKKDQAAEEKDESEEEEEEDEEEEEGEESEETEAEAEAEEEEEPPPPPKKKVAKPRGRSRTAKVPRMKAVWGVFNNSNQRVAVFEYPKRKEADDHAAKLRNDKKSTHFVQMVKEPIEEKEKEKEEKEKPEKRKK
jgi:hypothetical protein